MEKHPIPGEQTDGRSGTRRSPDRWLWVGSLVFHLLVFMLLPTFTTEAKQPLQLLIEIVKPELKRQPVKPRGVNNPKPAARGITQPVKKQQAKPVTSEAAVTVPAPATTEPGAVAVQTEASVPDLQPTASEAATPQPIPEMVAVPTHQPIVIPPAADPVVVVEQPGPEAEPITQPPAPVNTQTTATQTLPAPASSTGSTGSTATNPNPVEAEPKVPDLPEAPVAGTADPASPSGAPAAGLAGPPGLGDEESAGPPGPSALELGMLGDYGDGARKKIRMLVRTPELARERGLKGKCKFEFELRSDGTLVGIKIIESSSHAVLDEECLEATRVAAPFKRFPGGVSVTAWKFQMEIVFPTY